MRKIVEHNIHSALSEKQIIKILNQKILASAININAITPIFQGTDSDLPTMPKLTYESLIVNKISADATNGVAKIQRQEWLKNELNRINNEN